MVDHSRRRMLIGGGSIAGLAFAGTLWSRHQSTALPAEAVPDLSASLPAASPAFLRLSAMLTGRERPDPLLGKRLYQDMTARYPDLDKTLALLEQKVVAAAGQPPQLKDAPLLAEVFQQLLSGWYLGVVGPRLAPRCIGFENTVSYEVVASWVSPPSYCAGQPFFWVDKPSQVH